MTSHSKYSFFRLIGICILFVLVHLSAIADDKVFPPKPEPPRLVNDLANMMSGSEQNQLEQKLVEYERNSSTQITIVTITSLGEYDVSDYAIKLGKLWGIGQQGKNNGVLVLVSKNEHKINISTGKGLEGALPDITCNHIILEEIRPAFKSGNYFQGLSKGADAIIAASKGEYKADDKDKHDRRGGPGSGRTALIIIVLVIYMIFRIFRGRGGGGGGGSYMSGRGFGTGFIVGNILGDILGGGGRGGEGGGDSGGFGGFGGGDFGGGGASGDW
ncbi:MAG: TPM domain-containing protein [Bacteroidota bacterium]